MSNANLKIILDKEGIGNLLKSAEIAVVCAEKANKIANRADGNWKVERKPDRQRVVYTVSAADEKTYFKNLNTNTLAKAKGSVKS